MLPFDTDEALCIADEAARLALELHGRAAVDTKSDKSLVTEADRALEAMLQEKLGRLAPRWSFLGEETGLTGDADGSCWVIDPIDGTTNFVRGLPIWCVSIGAVENGRATFGIIAVPPLGITYWAAAGKGAWRISGGKATRLRAPERAELRQEYLIGTNSTLQMESLRNLPCRTRNLGSLTYHLAAVADGALLASISVDHKLHDVAAGVCLCEEAGCAARTLDGSVWRAKVTTASEKQPLLVAPKLSASLILEGLRTAR